MNIVIKTFSVFVVLLLSTTQIKATENSMAKHSSQKIEFNDFEQKIAERMSLDIRYFCSDVKGKPSVASSKHCRTPLVKLPHELAELITTSNIGGIVLFAENVQDTAQVVTLTHDIQRASLKSLQGKPLIIAMDQEGGRVARFAKMTGFSGNLAIGATFNKHGIDFAAQVNRVIAKELNVLGINNNYAPVVDVNTNVDNPVINTRSFGESPKQVADLGVSAVKAIQAEGVMATLKHFPGHGDTHVDSHLGLPRVDHDSEMINRVDLLPFTEAIKHAQPAMIMTAHIQYPALDDSLLVSKSGEALIRPATMSRKILTDLLRNKMGFEGIIATDALDMGGIAHFFTEDEAVVETFVAGADLAVMPFKVRTPDDIEKFYGFVKAVAQALTVRIEKGDYSFSEFEQSITRLNHYKKQYIQLSDDSLKAKIATAKQMIANEKHLLAEQSLANAAVTLLKNNQILPLNIDTVKKLYLVVANQEELAALNYAVQHALADSEPTLEHPRVHPRVEIKHFVASESRHFSKEKDIDKGHNEIANQYDFIAQADAVIATVDIKTASLVDLGGMDDLTPSYGSKEAQQNKRTFSAIVKQQLLLAKELQTPSILIAKGSPFLINEYSELADAVLLNFDDRIYQHDNGQLISPGFNASLAVILNGLTAEGKLPVTLKK